jgi:predicted Rdx family selenoprotein
LPNGNTLITESTIGRVFEITKNGTIVWEWFNPEINKDGKREGVYKMVRYPKNKIDEVIKFYDKSGH